MREKLIKLLQCSPTDSFGNHGVGALADHLIANGVTVQNWIPVTERLPEVRVPVLVYDGEYVDGREFYDLSYVSKYGITHWMPLPDPPKVE